MKFRGGNDGRSNVSAAEALTTVLVVNAPSYRSMQQMVSRGGVRVRGAHACARVRAWGCVCAHGRAWGRTGPCVRAWLLAWSRMGRMGPHGPAGRACRLRTCLAARTWATYDSHV